MSEEPLIAVFVDFENLALGVRDMKGNQGQFRIDLVLKRLLEKGRIVYKRAYCDWGRFKDNKNDFHEASVELIDIPTKRISGKNSADIRMVVDALDLCYQRDHITAFALITGDSDFSPLVNKLTEYNKYVIGLGVKNSTSELLVSVCDEFIFYEDLVREKTRFRQQQQQQRPAPPRIEPVRSSPGGMAEEEKSDSDKQAELAELLTDAFGALQRENHEQVWGSMIKQQIKRKKPQFAENYFGFGSFSDVLEAAKKAGLVDLRRDQRSGSYVVFEPGHSSGGGAGGGGGGGPQDSGASDGSVRSSGRGD